jgi:hypothetical protein
MPTLMNDDAMARRLEAIYSTPDVAAQRHETLRFLALAPGERVLDLSLLVSITGIPSRRRRDTPVRSRRARASASTARRAAVVA